LLEAGSTIVASIVVDVLILLLGNLTEIEKTILKLAQSVEVRSSVIEITKAPLTTEQAGVLLTKVVTGGGVAGSASSGPN
jgi:hypothetical protein